MNTFPSDVGRKSKIRSLDFIISEPVISSIPNGVEKCKCFYRIEAEEKDVIMRSFARCEQCRFVETCKMTFF